MKTRASVKVKAEKKEIVAEHASAMKTQASVRVKAEEKERTSAPQVPSKEEVIKALQKAYKEHESNQAALKSKLQKYCAVPEKWEKKLPVREAGARRGPVACVVLGCLYPA